MTVLPSMMPQMQRVGANRWLSRREPMVVGPSLGEMLWGVRGWHDDFFGHVLRDQYDQRTVGALSSIVLQPAAHGGVVRLTSGNVVADYARIMLGDRTYATNNLDADLGFRLIGRFAISSTASILVDLFVNAPAWNHIHISADTDHGPNWYLRTDDNSGVDAWADSGVAITTGYHWHELRASSGRAEHWLDGRLINVSTTQIPTVPTTANFRCLSRAAATKYSDLDYWGVIPE